MIRWRSVIAGGRALRSLPSWASRTLEIELTIDALRHISPDSVGKFVATEEYQVVKGPIALVADKGHALADGEAKASYQATPIVEECLVGVAAYECGGVHILVDEYVLDIQLDRLGSPQIDQNASFLDNCQHPKRGAKDFLLLSPDCIEPTAAESVDKRDAQSFPAACIERPLLEITKKVTDQHLMLCQAVRVKLRRSVCPVIVVLCQERAFLRCVFR